MKYTAYTPPPRRLIKMDVLDQIIAASKRNDAGQPACTLRRAPVVKMGQPMPEEGK